MTNEQNTVETPAAPVAPAPPTVTPPAVVAPAETDPPTPPEPVLASGRGLEVWKGATSVFVPVLDGALSPEDRREAVRQVMAESVRIDDKLNLVHGELLYELAENGYYKEWVNTETGTNFTTFEEYTEGELNMKKSKAHYLKKIYKVFVVELDLPTDKLQSLEWSKAKELTDVVTKANATELLDKVSSMSVKQVKDLVRAMKGHPPAVGASGVSAPATPSAPATVSADEAKIVLKFNCAPEQAENIQAAIGVAQTMTGSEVPANNLDLICSDFQAGAAGGGLSGVGASLDRIIKDLERAYGVTLEITSHDTERYDALKTEDTDAS